MLFRSVLGTGNSKCIGLKVGEEAKWLEWRKQEEERQKIELAESGPCLVGQ